MKPRFFIAPCLALLISGIWIGRQQTAILEMENENALLRTQLADDSASASASTSRVDHSQMDRAKPLDWTKAASVISEMQRSNGLSDRRSMMHLQNRFGAMSVAELSAALDELAQLDLTESARQAFESLILDSLLRKDPELALNRFIDRFKDPADGVTEQLISGFEQWTKKDANRATSWLDQRIAEGIFDSKSLDGRNDLRSKIEGSLLALLLPENLAAAGLRISSLPGEMKYEVVRDYAASRIQPENYENFATLVRSQLPQENQMKAITGPLYQLAPMKGYSPIGEYLERINATPAEKNQVVATAAQFKAGSYSNDTQIFTIGEMDAMREWAGSQSPEMVDRATAIAIESISKRPDTGFANAAELALHYQETTGKDEILATFLESPVARNNKEQSLTLTEKITDETRRAEILKTLESSEP